MFLHTTLAWNLDPVLHIYWYASNTPPLKANNNQEHQISHPSSCWCFAAAFLNFTYICFDKEFIRDRSKRLYSTEGVSTRSPEPCPAIPCISVSVSHVVLFTLELWSTQVPRFKVSFFITCFQVFDRRKQRLVEELIDGKIVLSMRAIYQSKVGLTLINAGMVRRNEQWNMCNV